MKWIFGIILFFSTIPIFSSEYRYPRESNGVYVVFLDGDPETTIQRNKLSSLRVEFRKEDSSLALLPALIEFDARMPKHDHSMTTVPEIGVNAKASEFEINGINLHMPGYWELSFRWIIGGKRNVITVPVMVP